MKILAGNWKLNKNRSQTKDFFKGLDAAALNEQNKKGHKFIIATSDLLLETAKAAAASLALEIYAQNVAFEKNGALTGESSAEQLLEIGIQGTLIAHSERRQFFGETNETAFKRMHLALEAGLKVIFCIGETLDQRKKAETLQVLKAQLTAFTPNFIQSLKPSQLMIAYEPVWAIGTGLVAEVPQIQEAHTFIRETLNVPEALCPILYGGSVKPNNFSEICSIPAVAGGLVGGASLDASSFSALAKCF